ncbi:hypothetical protein VQ643_01520 [Pseudomonas sp. F1_0610]|uniref:hypothetical protein n=1 Tax=Pseudomonas sp. F1_0610 TaxID=3114284 RepID=UPI0039C4E1A7
MRTISLLFLLLFSSLSLATGPSYVEAQLNPLALNAQGAILYKFFTTTNSSGGHYLQPVQYGVGVFQDGSFHQLKETQLNTNTLTDPEEAFYLAQNAALSTWFDARCSQDDLFTDFKTCNLAPYSVKQAMSVKAFKAKYAIDLHQAKLHSLMPAKFYAANEDSTLFVDYDFGKMLVLHFKQECSLEENQAQMMVINKPLSDHMEEEITYDCGTVSAIVYK